tara:strand:+ start:2938 stop:4458 length:1521 start_codon:yes stop_codon:yes gene_type:complete
VSAADKLDLTVAVAAEFRIDTRQEPVLFLRSDSPVARSEGFEAMSRVNVRAGSSSIVATLMIVGEGVLPPGYAGLSDAAKRLLQVNRETRLEISYPQPVSSLTYVRSKIYGNELQPDECSAIIEDIVAGRYMDVHLAAFVSACSGRNLSRNEVVSLTKAMVEAGEQLDWPGMKTVDKHCVGGLPGNRTTPIIVPIVASLGLAMPKTSSRAITSPSGTADTMEILAPVDLSTDQMRHVVESEGGCIVWGGSVRLSPADDTLIRVERALDVDSEGQLVASVLSKKLAAGSDLVVIDMPVGPTAKVRSVRAAEAMTDQLQFVGASLGLSVHVVTSDGLQPVGRGVGPALEARDVLSVLQGEESAPADLRDRAVCLAGVLLETGGRAAIGHGRSQAERALDDGSAWRKFQAICEAQGGIREIPQAPYRYEVFADRPGDIEAIDNRVIARIAKLAGAPADKAAGVDMSVRLGDTVDKGDLLFTIHAESPGELEYALQFEREQAASIQIGDS